MKTPIIALSLLLLASAADAQRLADTRGVTPAPAPAASISQQTLDRAVGVPARSTGDRSAAMAFTGTLFGAAGIIAGAYAGAGMACAQEPGDFCGLGGAILGAVAGEVLMLPAGIHVASANTSYGQKLLISSAVMLGGMVLAPVTAGISLLAIPPVQLGMLMAAENRAPERTR